MKSARILPFAKALIASCHRLYQTGLCRGMANQISALDDDIIWFSPQNLSFGNLQPEHLIPVLPDGRMIEESNVTLSEQQLALHQKFYRVRPDAKVIIMTRPSKLYAWLSQYSLNQPSMLALKHFGEPIFTLPSQETDTPETVHHQIMDAVQGTNRFVFSKAVGLIQLAETLERACATLEEAEAAAEIELLQIALNHR